MSLFICVCISVHVTLSVRTFAVCFCSPVCLSVHLSLSLLICLSRYISISVRQVTPSSLLTVRLSLSACLFMFIRPCLYLWRLSLSLCLSVCLSVCLSLSQHSSSNKSSDCTFVLQLPSLSDNAVRLSASLTFLTRPRHPHDLAPSWLAVASKGVGSWTLVSLGWHRTTSRSVTQPRFFCTSSKHKLPN